MSPRTYIFKLEEAALSIGDLGGGKGLNLSKLVGAGFPVPPGFVVTTSAYRAFLDSNPNLRDELHSSIAGLNYDDLAVLNDQAGAIRTLVQEAPIPPDLADEVTAAYNDLGKDRFVAVRSSGSAEDLPEASFAGMHDTYLDICGPDAVLEAVHACWASMWTSRALGYRKKNQIDDLSASMAVVVQLMVDSEVAGVLFTGNPMNTATDEMVIDASWGLGEAVVQGIVTPDTFILKERPYALNLNSSWLETAPPKGNMIRVKKKTLGSKELQIVRNPDVQGGTITAPTPDAKRGEFTLSDRQLADLAELGREVERYYDGFPQDIEFAFQGGKLYLLQARPITGVDFTWDADVDQPRLSDIPDQADTVWTKAVSDDMWTGAKTPLFYSYRRLCWEVAYREAKRVFNDPTFDQMGELRFYKSEAYFNTELHVHHTKRYVLPSFRRFRLAPTQSMGITAEQIEEIRNASFSPLNFVKSWARLYLVAPQHGARKWIKNLEDEIYDPNVIAGHNGVSDGELGRLSDRELKRHTLEILAREFVHDTKCSYGFFYMMRDTQDLLSLMLEKWYVGNSPNIFADLVTGLPVQTATVKENRELWELSEQIRNSPQLFSIFENHQGREFFSQLESIEEGRAFLDRYRAFVSAWGHRGAEDRDEIHPRRAEDASIDYRNFQMLLRGHSIDPEVQERSANERREATVTEVIDRIRKQPFGALKANAFRSVYEYFLRFLVVRDDERDTLDRLMLTQKRCFLEFGRRLHARGIVEDERDVWFLSLRELFDVIDGVANMKLAKAKIRAREQAFDRLHNKEAVLPSHLQGYDPLTLRVAASPGEGRYVGLGMNRGVVTATARVVKKIGDLSRLKAGEILVTHSTDPGWSPAFLIVPAVITETGGYLAHATLLCREYGLPNVQLDHAMTVIPDGATITVNGDTGEVTIIAEEPGECLENVPAELVG